MKIVSAYKDGWIDPPVMKIMEHVQYTNLNFTAVVVTIRGNYIFNPELLKINGPWVLFDFCEYGWDWNQEDTHIFGANIEERNHLFNFNSFNNSPDKFEWLSFNSFVYMNPPVLYFKRELLAKDCVINKLLPIEYPGFHPIPKIDSFEFFTSRPIDISYLWGESHPDRTNLHIEMYRLQSKFNYHLLDNAQHISGCFNDVAAGERRVWLSQKIPHYARFSMEDVLYVGLTSKMSISMPGAGVKCFRHAESPINAIMLMPNNKTHFQWSYPWIHGFNCLRFDTVEDINNLFNTNASDLYEIYTRGVRNAEKYSIENYVPDYILNQIELVLNT